MSSSLPCPLPPKYIIEGKNLLVYTAVKESGYYECTGKIYNEDGTIAKICSYKAKFSEENELSTWPGNVHLHHADATYGYVFFVHDGVIKQSRALLLEEHKITDKGVFHCSEKSGFIRCLACNGRGKLNKRNCPGDFHMKHVCKLETEKLVVWKHVEGQEVGPNIDKLNGKLQDLHCSQRVVAVGQLRKAEEKMDLPPQPGPSRGHYLPTEDDQAFKPVFDTEGRKWREEIARMATLNRAWKAKERNMLDRLEAMRLTPDEEAKKLLAKEKLLFEAAKAKFEAEKIQFEAEQEAALAKRSSLITMPKTLDHPSADRLLIPLHNPSVATQPAPVIQGSAKAKLQHNDNQDQVLPSTSNLQLPASACGTVVTPEGKGAGPKRLKSGLKANRSPNIVEAPVLFERNLQLGTFYSPGKKDEIERLDSSQTSNDELNHTLQLNNVLAPLNAPRLLLLAILWTLLENAGLALEAIMPQLCQVCWAPSALRFACGHAGLCGNCGGGNKETCTQCDARDGSQAEQEVTDEYIAGERILQLSEERYIVVQQRFLTYTEDEAIRLSRKEFDHIPYDRIKHLFLLNGLFKNWHFEDPEHARKILRCHFLACTEVKCRQCGIRSRIKPRGCPHDAWCRKCIEKNNDRCLMCGIDVQDQGFSKMEHSVVPTAELE